MKLWNSLPVNLIEQQLHIVLVFKQKVELVGENKAYYSRPVLCPQETSPDGKISPEIKFYFPNYKMGKKAYKYYFYGEYHDTINAINRRPLFKIIKILIGFKEFKFTWTNKSMALCSYSPIFPFLSFWSQVLQIIPNKCLTSHVQANVVYYKQGETPKQWGRMGKDVFF